MHKCIQLIMQAVTIPGADFSKSYKKVMSLKASWLVSGITSCLGQILYRLLFLHIKYRNTVTLKKIIVILFKGLSYGA